MTPTPLLYDDATGEMAVGGNVVTLDGRGYRRFYCPETRFDYVIEGGGVGKRLLFLDGVGGWERGGTAWINARDYPSIQEAVNALSTRGGVVYIPAGNYSSRSRPLYLPPLVLPESIPVRVVGDGPHQTILQSKFAIDPPFDPNKDYVQITGRERRRHSAR